MFFRFVEPGQQSACLFLVGDVEEKLDHLEAIVSDILFEVFDLFKAAFKYGVGIFNERPWNALEPGEYFRVHAHDQHFFVVAAVKHADPAALRHALNNAPQVPVIQFFVTGLFKRVNLHAGRVYTS